MGLSNDNSGGGGGKFVHINKDGKFTATIDGDRQTFNKLDGELVKLGIVYDEGLAQKNISPGYKVLVYLEDEGDTFVFTDRAQGSRFSILVNNIGGLEMPAGEYICMRVFQNESGKNVFYMRDMDNQRLPVMFPVEEGRVVGAPEPKATGEFDENGNEKMDWSSVGSWWLNHYIDLAGKVNGSPLTVPSHKARLKGLSAAFTRKMEKLQPSEEIVASMVGVVENRLLSMEDRVSMKNLVIEKWGEKWGTPFDTIITMEETPDEPAQTDPDFEYSPPPDDDLPF